MNFIVFKVLIKKDIFVSKRVKNGIVILDLEEYYFFGEKIFKIYMILIYLMEILVKYMSILKIIVEIL